MSTCQRRCRSLSKARITARAEISRHIRPALSLRPTATKAEYSRLALRHASKACPFKAKLDDVFRRASQLLSVELGLRRRNAATYNLQMAGIIFRLPADVRRRGHNFVNAIRDEFLRGNAQREWPPFRETDHEAARAVGVHDLSSDVQRRALDCATVIVTDCALHDVLCDGERIRVSVHHHAAEAIQIRAHAKRVTQMPVRSHIRRNRELQRSCDTQGNVECQGLLKGTLRPKRQIYVLIVGAEQEAVASEVTTEREGRLARSSRNQLQQAEARGKVFPYGSRKNCRGLTRCPIGALRSASKIIRVNFEALANSAATIKICSLRAAALSIRSK